MSAQQWCKVASNLDTHPKIRRARRNGREVFLFVLRRNAEPGNPIVGQVPEADLDPGYLAEQLMMTECDASDGVTRAVAAKLIERVGDAYAIVGWDSDQWGKENGSAERMRRKRERDKAEGTSPNGSPQRSTSKNKKKNAKLPATTNTNPQPEMTSPGDDVKPRDATETSRDVTVTGGDTDQIRSDQTRLDQTRLDQTRREAEADAPAAPRGNEAAAAASGERVRLVMPVWPEGVFDPNDPRHRGMLAESVWRVLSEARVAIGAELGLTPMPLPPMGTGGETRGSRDLRDRIRAEGALAPMVCINVVSNLVADARETRLLDWLSEKAFSEGSWQRCRDSASRMNRAPPKATGPIGAAHPRSDHPDSDESLPFGAVLNR